MILPRVIPCLDCRDGRVVKGVRFQGLRDAGDPVERARRYAEEGADELVLLDVSATPEGRDTALRLVEEVRAVLPIPLTVGGGVRTLDDAERLLAAGADKVAVNTAAVERPGLIEEISVRLGAQCAVIAIDAARMAPDQAVADTAEADERSPFSFAPRPRFEVVTHGGRSRTGVDAVAWAAYATSLGAGEVLLTSWDRDGTRDGYDLALLGAACDAVDVPVIASGGAHDASHLAEAIAHGAGAVLVASMLHDGDTTVDAIKRELHERGLEVRR